MEGRTIGRRTLAEGHDESWNPQLGMEWDELSDKDKQDSLQSVNTVISNMLAAGYDIRYGDNSVDRDSFADAVAEVAHDAWSAGKLADGCSYAAERDNTKKHHTCLLPYDMLSDSEKQYDIAEAKTVYDAITANGAYEIIKKKA